MWTHACEHDSLTMAYTHLVSHIILGVVMVYGYYVTLKDVCGIEMSKCFAETIRSLALLFDLAQKCSTQNNCSDHIMYSKMHVWTFNQLKNGCLYVIAEIS